MPNVPINPYSHGLTKEQAIQQIEQRRPQLLSEFGGQASNVEVTWKGSVLHFSFETADRRRVIGAVTVKDEWLYLDVDVNPLRFYERPLAPVMVQKALIPWLDTIFKS